MDKAKQQPVPAWQPLSMHPKKFALWLGLVSITLMFGGFTSALIVNQSDNPWVTVDMPVAFWVSSVLIAVSSGTLWLAHRALKRDNFGRAKAFLAITFVLGVAFLWSQWAAWGALVEANIFWVGVPSGSFIYVFSGAHAAHIVSALVVVLIALWNVVKQRIHGKNLFGIEMCSTYWHFLGGLWLYLFVFLLINY